MVIFILVSFFVWLGLGTGTGALWFSNWNPAIQGDEPVDQFVNIAGAFTTAFFSFGGIEMLGLTAGEASNPRKTVPKAINGTFFKIFFFYIGALFFVGVLLSPNDPILQSETIDTSPFVWVYNQVGITFAAHLMNFVIITAVVAAANSAIYASARTLARLAEEGSAPQLFAKVDKRGVPMNSVFVTALVGLAAVAAAYGVGADGAGHVFNWLASVISFGILAAWSIMTITHLRFRAGFVAQGRKVEELPYVAPFFPWMDYISLAIGLFTAGCLFLSAFYDVKEYDINWFTSNAWVYCGFPAVVLCYVLHATFKSGFGLVKYEDMDFETGRYIETTKDKEENEREDERAKGLSGWLDNLRSSKLNLR
ncbi:hypothetical protein HDU98_000994 [Podochytrium sp. JEL0797]|nr:hypothetical protein HDU98_000994 [Podochytrium sp. JEL0797]